MEFNEKLQELRKSRGLTQEELAEVLYVSRGAVAKWEQGRGYPSIDSLKDISKYFSVTVDELLSGEKLISIAERENRESIGKLCSLIYGLTDMSAVALIILPLYPYISDGYVYSVSLPAYSHTGWIKAVYWVLYICLVAAGAVKIWHSEKEAEKGSRAITVFSMCINIVTVLFLALAKEAYAVAVAFMILIIKGAILLKYTEIAGK